MISPLAKRLIGVRVAAKVADEVAQRMAGQTDQVVDIVVRKRAAAVIAAVEFERLRNPDLSPHDLAQHLVYQRAKLAAGSGAATSLPSIVPGLGTVIGMGTAVLDTVNLLYNEVTLILAIACVYGRDLRDPDARKLDILLVLAMDAGVAVPSGDTIEVLGETVEFGAVPGEVIGKINRRVGATVGRRVSRRRQRVIFGREVPLGIGVAVGGAYNFWSMRKVGRTAIRYFER